jgi:hypothetical protein
MGEEGRREKRRREKGAGMRKEGRGAGSKGQGAKR